MASLNELPSSQLVKVVVAGESGTRKTTGLASLARAGYNLFIIDADNGLGALRRELSGPADKEALARIDVIQCFDKLKNASGRIMIDGPAKAWTNAMNALTNWPGKGPLEKWTDKDVLVVDTLTTLGASCLRYIQQLNGHEDKPTLPDFGSAMDLLEKAIMLLSSPASNCHVVLNTHVNTTENDSGVVSGYPSALGNKLSPKIPIYFDNVLVAIKKGSGDVAKYTYELRGTQLVMGKSSYRGQSSLDNLTGLAEFFKQLRST